MRRRQVIQAISAIKSCFRQRGSDCTANRAISRTTGETATAQQLNRSRQGTHDTWDCPTCGVEMIPVACGKKQYKVTPHFRAAGTHDSHGDRDGVPTPVETGASRLVKDSMGPPKPIPSKFILPRTRPQRVRGDGAEHGEPKPQYRRGPAAPPESGETHESSVTTIVPIAEAYFGTPPARKETLETKGSIWRTYEECIKRLYYTGRFRKIARPIVFAPIRFRGLDLRRPNHEIGLDLDADTKSPVDAFFLCQQEERDLSTFIVDDHRAVCFYDLCTNKVIT